MCAAGDGVGRREEARQRLRLVRHLVRTRVVARLAVQGPRSSGSCPRCGARGAAPRSSSRSVGEVDVTRIERLHRVDRVDVGVDRPRLHLEVRPAAADDVAEAAGDDARAAVGRAVERRPERVVARVALRRVDDVLAVDIGVRHESVADEVERLRHAGDREVRVVGRLRRVVLRGHGLVEAERRQDTDLDPLHDVAGDQGGPERQVGRRGPRGVTGRIAG